VRIFFTGITGLIGRYFAESIFDRKHELFGTSCTDHRALFDSRFSSAAVPAVARDRYAQLLATFRPDVIVNAASVGNVDSVERDPAAAFDTNVRFPLFLLEQASALRARFVQFSSNAVYGGDRAPYVESDAAAPLNAYGRQKALVDRETRRSGCDWMIVRPSVAYAWNFPFGRTNPVSFFLPRILRGERIRLVTDVYENPVWAGDVAAVLLRCLGSGFGGELNIAGSDSGINRFQWMSQVAEVFEVPSPRLEAVTLDAFPELAPRPKDTRFDTSRLRRELCIQTLSVREGAALMRRTIGAGLST
jgi:dTDP-4-dehydrorhamnose reductase